MTIRKYKPYAMPLRHALLLAQANVEREQRKIEHKGMYPLLTLPSDTLKMPRLMARPTPSVPNAIPKPKKRVFVEGKLLYV